MTDEALEETHGASRGPEGAGILDSFVHAKAAVVAKVAFDLAERLIILTGITFAERKAPATAKAGLYCLKMVLGVIFVFWIVTPFARSIMRASRTLKARVGAHPVLGRALTLVYFAAVVVIAMLVSRMLNYFLSYLSPGEG